MFRSTDDPIVTIESKISIRVKLYLKLRYSEARSPASWRRGVGASLGGLAAAIPEEVAEKGRGAFSEEAAFGGEGVVEAGVGGGVVEGAGVAGFGVGGGED